MNANNNQTKTNNISNGNNYNTHNIAKDYASFK